MKLSLLVKKELVFSLPTHICVDSHTRVIIIFLSTVYKIYIKEGKTNYMTFLFFCTFGKDPNEDLT